MVPGEKGKVSAQREICSIDGKRFYDGYTDVDFKSGTFENGKLLFEVGVTLLRSPGEKPLSCEIIFKGELADRLSCNLRDPGDDEKHAKCGLNNQDPYECSESEYKNSDIGLNSAYKQLIGKVTADYKPHQQQGLKVLGRIKISQITWLTLRQENCAVEVSAISPETRAYETAMNYCIAKEKAARTRYLNGLSL